MVGTLDTDVRWEAAPEKAFGAVNSSDVYPNSIVKFDDIAVFFILCNIAWLDGQQTNEQPVLLNLLVLG